MFLGTNFGGLDNEKPPEVLEELDNVFPTYYLEWQFPWLFRLLCLVPHKSLHQYITTGHRFYKVSLCNSLLLFNNTVETADECR